MSYIMNRVACKNCNYEFNVSLGTFGGGVPEKCPECKTPADYKTIAEQWKMNDGKWFSEIPKD